ncbi:hypothetical protein BKA63DRAFT_154624 [Paraphoma chrysanthemicola]|nr:hypothetical protein BKA63DRAFT_154624 [Paraphoma chrysanthemicola]
MSRWNVVILQSALATICAALVHARKGRPFNSHPWHIWASSTPRSRLHGSFEGVIFFTLAQNLAVLFWTVARTSWRHAVCWKHGLAFVLHVSSLSDPNVGGLQLYHGLGSL